MARPKATLADRVAGKTQRDGEHLIWTGPMRGRRPVLRDFGNPVRVLLNLVDQPRISIRPVCLEPRCIEPTHWKVVIERDRIRDDAPPPKWVDPRLVLDQFTERERRDIQMWIELISTGEATRADMAADEDLTDLMRDEIARATA